MSRKDNCRDNAPVVDDSGEMAGIVWRGDILRAAVPPATEPLDLDDIELKGETVMPSAILVATDFSATATRALRAALDGFPDAAHNVVHAYWLPYEGRITLAADAPPEDIERLHEQAREFLQRKLDAFIADADYRAAGGVRGLVRQGFAPTALLDEAMRSDADLLVVGKHGASALDERLLGSVTLNVLHHASCDVLLVP